MRKALACSAVLLAVVCTAVLAATPVTGELTVNTTLAGSQDQPSVALDADGDFAVGWEDGNTGSRNIQLRRFTRAGTPASSEITMDAAADSQDPALGMSATGAGVAVWQSVASGQTIARRFDADSAEGPEVPVNASTATAAPDVAMDADGDFVVVWEDNTAADAIVRAQRFDETGATQGSVFTVNEPASLGTDSLDPAIAIDNAGSFVVAWERPAGGNDDVIARVFNADGSPRTGDLTVATGATDQDDPEAAMDADGDLAVAWESGDDVLARRYSSAGGATTSAFPVNSTTAGAQGNVRIGLDDGGGSLAASWDSDAGGSDDVVTRRFNMAGTPLSGEVGVNTTLAGNQADPGLGVDATGRFVVAWESDGTATDVIARAFDPVTPQSQQPPSPPPPPPPSPGGGRPDCQDPTRILVTCLNPSGAFTIPGVCGPSFGTILPACNLPSNPPTVCGPSFGTILTACQLPQSRIMACGGFGTILPQCNNPPNSVPKVCGGGGTSLPRCTGANQLALACGPSTGTPLPACNFPTKINATPLQAGKSATLTLTLSCPPSGATTSAVGRGARAAQKAPDTCDMSLALKYMRVSLSETLAAHAGDVGVNFTTAAGLINDLERVANDPDFEAKSLRRLQTARANQQIFYGRAGDLIQRYLGTTRVNEEVDRPAATRYLLQRDGPRDYVGIENVEFGNAFAGPIGLWVESLANAVRRYRQLEGGAGGKSSAGDAATLVGPAQVRRQRGGRVLSKRYKVKTGLKRASKRRGKTRKIKIKLSKRTVNTLVREAARSKRSKRVVPLRLLVSYRGKVQGRRIPVARMIDVQLRVKQRAKRKKR